MDLRTAEETKRRLLSEKASLEEKVIGLEKKKSNEVCCLNVFVFSVHSIFILIFLFDCTDFFGVQMENLQKDFEKECKGLKLQVSELQRKLEEAKHDLIGAQSGLEAKDKELEMLQNNLKELEELREMKEVNILY